ncbi:hypothetical protein [Methylobacterium sp. J-068]|uniref:hypothetical protein n=1 Tax=Methylobacterium sp. J-068 TaxID=2836649 RepID=UPI001FBAAC37|nr:hypothetical protein [Methylobacterium sp. J-068]MCJ2035766.1 hypothetical protein [Methylobacterium sp. J-068]
MAEIAVVTVTIEDREDGWIQVSSDSLPGLVLSGPDHEQVVECIMPAIRDLYEMYGHSVVVRAARPARSFLEGPSPRDIDVHVTHSGKQREFVVEFAEAA